MQELVGRFIHGAAHYSSEPLRASAERHPNRPDKALARAKATARLWRLAGAGRRNGVCGGPRRAVGWARERREGKGEGEGLAVAGRSYFSHSSIMFGSM
jgi:hypothetical protein